MLVLLVGPVDLNISSKFYVARLDAVVSNITAEVKALDRALTQSINGTGSSIAEPAPQESPSPQPNATPVSPDVELKRSASQATVDSLSADQLRAASAPAELAGTQLPQSGCNNIGRPISTTFSRLDEFICRTAQDIAVNRRNRRVLISQDQSLLFAIITSKVLKTEGGESYVAFVSEAQEARTDQQMGAGPTSTGTTSLVVKDGVPYVLSLAVENGAAVQSRSGTTVTFRVNPMGLMNTFANKGFISGFRQAEQDPVQNFLRKSLLGFTFDTLCKRRSYSLLGRSRKQYRIYSIAPGKNSGVRGCAISWTGGKTRRSTERKKSSP